MVNQMFRFHVLIIFAALLPATALAQTQVHTSLTSFNNALDPSASITILDCESFPAGTPVLPNSFTYEGFGFVYGFENAFMQFSDTSLSNSGTNYLGTSDADMFQDGDNFEITMEPSVAFGIHFISKDELIDGDINVTFNGTTASLVGMDVEQTLNEGSQVYFLGITMDQPHTSATIQTLAQGVFLYNVDDIIRAVETIDCLLGDVNQDGFVNLLDVDPFIQLIALGVFQCEADTNQDGFVNLLDVDPFIAIIAVS